MMYNAIKNKFKRVGHIEIVEARNSDNGMLKKSLFVSGSGETGLDFKFDWKTNSDDNHGVTGVGSVGILGLQGDTIRSLIEFGTQEEAAKKARYVLVYAGYESDATAESEPLFTMPIYGASITQPPEMWLNIASYTGAQAQLSVLVENASEESSKDDVNSAKKQREALERRRKQNLADLQNSKSRDLKTFITNRCTKYNIKLKWDIGESDYKKIPEMDFPETDFTNVTDFVKYLNTLGWIYCYFDQGGSLDYGSSNPFGGIWSYDLSNPLKVTFNGRFAYRANINAQKSEWDKKKREADGRDPINMDTGMIGIPQFRNMQGKSEITVKSLLRRDIKFGDFIVVESDFIDIPKGTYYQVNAIEYEGEFRGQAWYVKYTAIKTDRPVDKYTNT